MHTQPPRIEARGLGKVVRPVTGCGDVTLQAGAGGAGVLGHNGAARPRWSTCLPRARCPAAGRPGCAGRRRGVRPPGAARIGLTGQFVATRRDAVRLRQPGVDRPAARRGPPPGSPPARTNCSTLRVDRCGAAQAGSTYSGGMRRRLDLAASLNRAPRRAVSSTTDHRPRPGPPRPRCACSSTGSRPTAPRSYSHTQDLARGRPLGVGHRGARRGKDRRDRAHRSSQGRGGQPQRGRWWLAIHGPRSCAVGRPDGAGARPATASTRG